MVIQEREALALNLAANQASETNKACSQQAHCPRFGYGSGTSENQGLRVRRDVLDFAVDDEHGVQSRAGWNAISGNRQAAIRGERAVQVNIAEREGAAGAGTESQTRKAAADRAQRTALRKTAQAGERGSIQSAGERRNGGSDKDDVVGSTPSGREN